MHYVLNSFIPTIDFANLRSDFYESPKTEKYQFVGKFNVAKTLDGIGSVNRLFK